MTLYLSRVSLSTRVSAEMGLAAPAAYTDRMDMGVLLFMVIPFIRIRRASLCGSVEVFVSASRLTTACQFLTMNCMTLR